MGPKGDTGDTGPPGPAGASTMAGLDAQITDGNVVWQGHDANVANLTASGTILFSATKAEFNNFCSNGDFRFVGDPLSAVDLSGTKAQFNAACSDGDFVYVGDTIGANFISGTGAQFNAACTDYDFVLKDNDTVWTSFAGSASFQGFATQAAGATASVAKTIYFDFRNSDNNPVTSIFNAMNTDGSSNISFYATPAGSRTVDRRIQTFTVFPNFCYVGNNGSATAVAAPPWLRFDNQFSATPGTASACKIKLFDDNAGGVYGFGVAGNILEYHAPTGADHRFYVAGNLKAAVSRWGIGADMIPMANTSASLQAGDDIGIVGGGDNGAQSLHFNSYYDTSASAWKSSHAGYTAAWRMDANAGSLQAFMSSNKTTAGGQAATVAAVFSINSNGDAGCSNNFYAGIYCIARNAHISQPAAGGNGYSQLVAGDSSHGGYVRLNSPDGSSQGYMGYNAAGGNWWTTTNEKSGGYQWNGLSGNDTTMRAQYGAAAIDHLCSTSGNGYLYNRYNSSLIFGTNNSDRAYIGNGGNFYIGTYNLWGIVGSGSLRIYANSGEAGNYGMCLDYEGGDHTPIQFVRNGAQVGTVFCTASGTAYNTTSDRALKKNIEDPVEDPETVVNEIKIRQFDWLEDDKHQNFGVIAQELYEVYPDAVYVPHEDDGRRVETNQKSGDIGQPPQDSPPPIDLPPQLGNPIQPPDPPASTYENMPEPDPQHRPADLYWGVDHSKLVPVMIADIQKKHKRITSLEQTVTQLQQMLEAMAVRMAKLEAA
jgi:hypothetical protein